MEKQLFFETDAEPISLTVGDGKDEKKVEGMVKVGIGNSAEKAGNTLSKSLESIKDLSNAIDTKLNEAIRYPDEVTLEYGIKIGVEGNVYVVKGSGEAHIKLSLKWKKES